MRQVTAEVTASATPKVWKIIINSDTSQLGISYHGGPLAPEQAGATSTLRTGDRAPDAICRRSSTGEKIRLFDLFCGPRWTVVVSGDQDPVVGIPFEINSAKLRTYMITKPGAATSDTAITIRPDGYLARVTDLTTGNPPNPSSRGNTP